MPQVHCYLNETLAKRLQEKAQHQHISVSKYIAGRVEKEVGNQGPEGFFALAGSWEGEFEIRESFD